jgi:hypothetical protein
MEIMLFNENLTFYLKYTKKTKYDAKIRFSRDIFLYFLHSPHKVSVFCENLSAPIECGYVNTKKELFNL